MANSPAVEGKSGEADLLMEKREKDIISDQPFALDKGLLWSPGLSVNLSVKSRIEVIIGRHK
jgi:hypothetical protein